MNSFLTGTSAGRDNGTLPDTTPQSPPEVRAPGGARDVSGDGAGRPIARGARWREA